MEQRARPGGEGQELASDGATGARLLAPLGRLVASVSAPEVRAVVNGLYGDTLVTQDSPLAVPMTLRTLGGSRVEPTREGLAGLEGGVSGELCLFVHGLMGTESSWRSAAGEGFGDRLRGEHGVTPLYLRYNTGRHISVNGRQLAGLLATVARHWPVPLRRIDLVGHSMGGLVARSACHYGVALSSGWLPARGRRFVRRVRRVVLLGVPNTGAPLEVIANQISAGLWSLPFPVARLAGRGLDHRSDGIKDLRFGFVVDEDWQEQDAGLTRRPSLHPARLPGRARVLVVAGSVTADDHPLGRFLGDALVTASSASGDPTGDGARPLFAGATVRSCPGLNHLALSHRPEVYREIAGWW